MVITYFKSLYLKPTSLSLTPLNRVVSTNRSDLVKRLAPSVTGSIDTDYLLEYLDNDRGEILQSLAPEAGNRSFSHWVQCSTWIVSEARSLGPITEITFFSHWVQGYRLDMSVAGSSDKDQLFHSPKSRSVDRESN
jgi:hypothetical protein